MVIHYHHAIVPNSGYLKRMKNIDRDLVGLLGEKSVEVEFYSKGKREFVKTEGQFTLSQNVVKKYYVEMGSNGKLNNIKKIITFIKLSLKYRPTYVIGEAQMLPKLLWVFRMFAPKAKLIFDCHGAVAEEAEYQGRSESDVKAIKKMERNSTQKVDYIICQSSVMKQYIHDEYGVDEKRISVYRCGVDTSLFKINDKREEVRKHLGIAVDEILFVYSGGIDKWQRVGDSIDIFMKYHKVNPKSKFLILTMQEDRLKDVFLSKGIVDDGTYIVTSLPFQQVPDYLNACDVAFLLRDNHMMNAVASPTKLAEYMACGLPVITSEVARCWVDKEGENYCVFEEKTINTDVINSIIGTDRNAISEYAKKHLSLEADRMGLTFFVEYLKK